MKRANRPVPILVPPDTAAAGLKLTDSGVWSEGGLVFSTAGCIIDRGNSQPCGTVVLPSNSSCKLSVISAPTQDDCQSSHPDQPAISEPSTSFTNQDGSSSSSTSSRSHAVASTSSSETHQNSNTATGSTSSNSSSPINSSIVLSDLQELSVIGSGSSGVVKKVLHRPTQQVYVLKVINLDMGNQQVRRQVTREVRALDGARHPHVVSYHQSFFAEGAVTILMEFMDGGTLWDLLQKIRVVPEPYLAELTRQMLLGLSFLHDTARICHRDVKPSNLLLSSSGQLKISDFGTSSQLSNSMSKCLSWVGTVTYMSPERIRGDSYSFNTDVWSLGLLVLECAVGRYPYPPQQQGASEAGAGAAAAVPPPKLGFWELLEYIVVEPVPRLSTGQFSAELVDFVAQCLQKDAARRPSASQLLLHPFVASASSSPVSLADLLKLPARQQAHSGSSAAGRGTGSLRRSGNYGGLRGSSGGGAQGSGVLRQSSGGFGGVRGSLPGLGLPGAASLQPGLAQGSIMVRQPPAVQAGGAAVAAASQSSATAGRSALPSQAGTLGNHGGSSNSSLGSAAPASAVPASSCQPHTAAGMATAEGPSSPQPIVTTSPPSARTAAAAGPVTPAMAAVAAAALRESSPLLSGQLMRQSAKGTVLSRQAGLGAGPMGNRSPTLQQQQQQPAGSSSLPTHVRQSMQQQQHLRQQQPSRASPLQPPQQQQHCGPLQQQQHWLNSLAAQQGQQQQQQQQQHAPLRQQAAGQHQQLCRLHHQQHQQHPAQPSVQHIQGPLLQQLAGMHIQQQHHQQQQQRAQSGSPHSIGRPAAPQAAAADQKHVPAAGRLTPDKQLGAAGSVQGPLTALKPSTRRLHDAPVL